MLWEIYGALQHINRYLPALISKLSGNFSFKQLATTEKKMARFHVLQSMLCE